VLCATIVLLFKVAVRSNVLSSSPTGMGKGGGHLPLPGKGGVYLGKKTHIRSQFECPICAGAPLCPELR